MLGPRSLPEPVLGVARVCIKRKTFVQVAHPAGPPIPQDERQSPPLFFFFLEGGHNFKSMCPLAMLCLPISPCNALAWKILCQQVIQKSKVPAAATQHPNVGPSRHGAQFSQVALRLALIIASISLLLYSNWGENTFTCHHGILFFLV